MARNVNHRRPFERGEVVVAAGETVDRFFLVEEGVLKVDGGGSRGAWYLRRASLRPVSR